MAKCSARNKPEDDSLEDDLFAGDPDRQQLEERLAHLSELHVASILAGLNPKSAEIADQFPEQYRDRLIKLLAVQDIVIMRGLSFGDEKLN